jgi:MoxR-like ATPase
LDGLASWMGPETKVFKILYSKYTTPEEVFGPISVKSLKEDCYRRVLTNMLPEAHFGFGDEIFKAGSGILNTKLKVLNERIYVNGDGKEITCPLLQFVAASNEWPNDENGGKELGALFDRFLFRKHVKPVSKAGRKRLLWVTHQIVPSTQITPQEIELAHLEMRKLGWDVEVQQALEEILEKLNQEGIFPGDRRQVKSIHATQAYAYLNGSDTVQKEHLEILQHVLWDDPTEQPEKCARIVNKIANPIGMLITEKLAQAQDVINSIDPDQKHSVYDAVAKLESIRDELLALPNSPRCETAIEYVRGEIKRHYGKVVKGSL